MRDRSFAVYMSSTNQLVKIETHLIPDFNISHVLSGIVYGEEASLAILFILSV